MLYGNLREETDWSKKKEFWNSNIKVSGWNETDFCDKLGHTCLYQIKEQLWRNITVSSRIPKNENKWIGGLVHVSKTTDLPRMLVITGQPETRNHFKPTESIWALKDI